MFVLLRVRGFARATVAAWKEALWDSDSLREPCCGGSSGDDRSWSLDDWNWDSETFVASRISEGKDAHEQHVGSDKATGTCAFVTRPCAAANNCALNSIAGNALARRPQASFAVHFGHVRVDYPTATDPTFAVRRATYPIASPTATHPTFAVHFEHGRVESATATNPIICLKTKDLLPSQVPLRVFLLFFRAHTNLYEGRFLLECDAHPLSCLIHVVLCSRLCSYFHS